MKSPFRAPSTTSRFAGLVLMLPTGSWRLICMDLKKVLSLAVVSAWDSRAWRSRSRPEGAGELGPLIGAMRRAGGDRPRPTTVARLSLRLYSASSSQSPCRVIARALRRHTEKDKIASGFLYSRRGELGIGIQSDRAAVSSAGVLFIQAIELTQLVYCCSRSHLRICSATSFISFPTISGVP